jgi:hypothetical protein
VPIPGPVTEPELKQGLAGHWSSALIVDVQLWFATATQVDPSWSQLLPLSPE